MKNMQSESSAGWASKAVKVFPDAVGPISQLAPDCTYRRPGHRYAQSTDARSTQMSDGSTAALRNILNDLLGFGMSLAVHNGIPLVNGPQPSHDGGSLCHLPGRTFGSRES